jgi:hypothetical protein
MANVKPARGKQGAQLVMTANGVICTFRGAVTLDQVHGWLDRVASMGHSNWAILDIRDLKGAETGVWPTLEMGIKKLVKKGVKRMVFVVASPDQTRVVQSVTKRAGINNLAEYFDTSKRQYDQTRVVTYLRDNWKR